MGKDYGTSHWSREQPFCFVLFCNWGQLTELSTGSARKLCQSPLHFRHRAGSSARNPVSGILQAYCMHIIPEFPIVHCAEVRWRKLYQTHCRDTFATDLAFQSRCIPTECHRWRCRLIPCVQGALGDFLESPCPKAWLTASATNAGEFRYTTIREPHIMARGRAVVRCIGITYLRRDSNLQSLGP